MPDLARIKLKLEKRLVELSERAGDIDEELDLQGKDDWSENAKEIEDDEVLEQVGGMTVHEIQQIKAALINIEAGNFGICSICQEKIAIKRLEALPYATTCVACAKEESEK